MGRPRVNPEINDGKVAVSFRIDKALHRKLKIAQLFTEKTVADMVNDAISRYIKRSQKEWMEMAAQDMKEMKEGTNG